MPRISTEFPSASDIPNGLLVRSIKTDGLNADFFYSISDKPQEALILLGGSEGGKSWSDHTVHIQKFIQLGYAVLSLAYFGADGLPAHLLAVPLEYFTQAFHWLSSQKEVIPDKYTLLGVSRGAELALLLGSMYPEVKAVVAIAPSSVVFPGQPTGIRDALRGQHSAWSLQGREIAFVPLPYSLTTLRGMLTGRRTLMFEEALRNTAAVEAAAIPVEKTRGPILLESFTQDQIWPSTLMASQLANRLDKRGFGYSCKHTAHNTTHSNWSFEPCWTNILAFLRENRAVE
jgi:pimeloyl-ACP methyl ester carboxylesterase